MKNIKFVDFLVQTLLFVAVPVIVSVFRDNEWISWVLLLQVPVGIWQLLSSAMSLALRTKLYTLKRIHLVTSAAYIAVLFILPLREYSEAVMLTALMVPAWTLAVFYYSLTVVTTFQGPSRQSSFLPHTSF